MGLTVSGVTATGTASVKTKVKAQQKQKTSSNWFSDWLKDKDKVCTDGKDDGHISLTEGLKSVGKGFIGIVKTAINHPVATAVTVAAGAALTVATGGAALPVMAAAGAAIGAGMIGYGGYKAATAKTDGEAKQALETAGNGLFAVATAAAGAKSALSAAEKAGVTSAAGAKSMNTAKAVVQTFKSTPQALKVSAQNIKGNAAALATGAVTANSNKLLGSDKYMSKANDVQAYRFNPNGTEEEILANNPGVFRGTDGKYYVPNKWNPSQPYAIDTSKEQMIMMYNGTEDMAVCDGNIFKGSYVDQAAFKADGTKTYLDPATLPYGNGTTISATKQAPGAFKVVPEGTKVQTLEGLRTVGKGEVVAIDHDGNPYVTTAKNIVKRNTGISQEALARLAKVDPEVAAK